MQFRPELEDVLSPYPSLSKQSSFPLHLPQIVPDENKWGPDSMMFHENLDLVGHRSQDYQFPQVCAAVGHSQVTTGAQTQVLSIPFALMREVPTKETAHASVQLKSQSRIHVKRVFQIYIVHSKYVSSKKFISTTQESQQMNST